VSTETAKPHKSVFGPKKKGDATRLRINKRGTKRQQKERNANRKKSA